MSDPLNIAHLSQEELEGSAPRTPVETHVGVVNSETLLPPGHAGIPANHVGSQLRFAVEWLQCLTHPEKVAGRTKSQMEQDIASSATSVDADVPQKLGEYNTLTKLATNIDLGDFEVRDNFWQLTPDNAIGSLQARLAQHAIEKPAVMLLMFDNSRVLGVKGQLGQQYVLVDAVTGLMHSLNNPLFALPSYVEKHCKGAKVAGAVMVPKPPKGKAEEIPPEPEPKPEPVTKRKREPEPEPEKAAEPEPEPEPMEEEQEEEEAAAEEQEEEQSLASMMQPTKRTRRSSRRKRK